MMTFISKEQTEAELHLKHMFNVAQSYYANKLLQTNFNTDIDKDEFAELAAFAEKTAKAVGIDDWQPHIGYAVKNVKRRVESQIMDILPKDAFFKLLEDKKIAIVGSSPITVPDASTQIDNSDIVIRINNFNNYHLPNTGIKVDIILQTFTENWKRYPDERKNLPAIKKHHPLICCIKEPDKFDNYCKELFKDIATVKYVPYTFFRKVEYTTGTIALIGLATYLKNADVKVFGFEPQYWKDYIDAVCPQHKRNSNEEFTIQQQCIRKLESLKTT